MSKMQTLLAMLVTGFTLNGWAQTQAAPTGAASTAPVNIVLADGTPVKLRMGSTSTVARVGESLQLEVAEDVRVGDVVVIAKGSAANAGVTNLRSGANNGRGGWLDINLESVTLADGHKVPIRASRNKPFKDDESTIVSSSGQDASITQGTDLTTYINGNQPLDVTRLRAAGGPTTEVKVASTPPNAEVSVDGRVAGSTPSILHVTAGDHVVIVRMAGFQAWQQNVHVAGQPLALDAQLAKQDGSEPAPASKPAEPSLGELARAARARKAPPANSPAESGSQRRDPMEPQKIENQ
jgi:hypothetical protein